MNRNDTGLFMHEVLVSPDLLLSATEVRHVERVRRHIANAIAAAGGWIGFEHYMDLALYAPGLGYYSAGAVKLGAGGDFTTAPEISALFGACIADQCAEILQAVDNGCVLEIGAGSGRLAVDLLGWLNQMECLPSRYYILEISADLRARQRQLIAERLPRLQEIVCWLDAPLADSFDGVIVANEVLDALPVTRFRWCAGEYQELGVSCTDGEFNWAARQASAALTAACGRLSVAAGGWEDGYVSEVCPRLGQWTAAVSGMLRNGVALWIDYGLPRSQYYLPERHGGTLLCHFRQRAFEDPFSYPGLQDITAWVDFTALAEAGTAVGCNVSGFATQALYLAGTGIERAIISLAAGDANRFARLAVEARKLMMPGEMGERFKVMAWSRGIEREWRGFKLQDLRHTL